MNPILTKHVKNRRKRDVSTQTLILHQNVSLAHRYWVDGLGPLENAKLFGSMTSESGLGHNIKVSLILPVDMSLEDQRETMNLVKASLDHTDWRDWKPLHCSSLEVLLMELSRRLPPFVQGIEMRESRRIRAVWSRWTPVSLKLFWNRPLSVLYKDTSGGARLNFEFGFEGRFEDHEHVLVERHFLEQELEDQLVYLEQKSLKISRNVKDLEPEIDAMFKTLKKFNPLMNFIACELETGRKRLIHSPFLSR